MDWGSGGQASPASIGWWAVVQDDTVLDIRSRLLVGGGEDRVARAHLWVKKAWIAGKIKGREYKMPSAGS
jgi:hypothetical protein